MISDSGNRTEFSTGAVRDVQEGKGRCDLLPLDIVCDILEDDFLIYIEAFRRSREKQHLRDAINYIIDDFWGNEYDAILRLSKHFEEGAKKYGEYNWQKGIPCSRYLDSSIRHYLKYEREDKDEDHDVACLWNLICLMWTIKHKPEMNDLEGCKR